MCDLRPCTVTGLISLLVPASRLLLVATCACILSPTHVPAAPREQLIPVLSHALESRGPGTVAYLVVTFDTRSDTSGLVLQFKTSPGRFSRTAQASIEQAIRRTAQSLKLSTDSWTVVLSVPYPEITIYGEDLSGMVGLSVAAMAEGRALIPGLVMTGTITPEGRIGPVGTVPLRIPATGRGHLRRVIVSKEQAIAERDQPMPHVMQVSPIASVTQAFEELTDRSPKP